MPNVGHTFSGTFLFLLGHSYSYMDFYLITRGGILGGGAIQLKCRKMCVLIHAFLDENQEISKK